MRHPSCRDVLREARLWPLVIIFLGAIWMSSCSGVSEDDCHALLEAGEYESAVTVCNGDYREVGDRRAGLAAAMAAYYLGRDAEVISWVDELRDTEQEAILLGYVGSAYRRQGKAELAREAMDRKIALHAQEGEYEHVAATYYTLFQVAWGSSDFRDMIDSLRLCFENAERAENEHLRALAIQGLVSALLSIGDIRGATEALSRADTLVPPTDPSRAYLENYRGIIARSEGQPILARQALEQALDLAEGSNDPLLLRSIRVNLVAANVQLEDLEQASAHLEAAEALPRNTPNSDTALLRYRAMIEHARGDYAKAIDSANAALELDPPPDAAWELYDQLGMSRQASGDLRGAQDAFEQAIASVEEMREALGFDDLKASLVDKKRRPYESLFALQAGEGRIVDALATIERAKARTFLDALVRETYEVRATPSTDVWDRQEALGRLDALVALRPSLNESSVAGLRPVSDLLADIAGRPFVVYFQTEQATWVISSADSAPRLHKISATTAEIDRRVNALIASPDDRQLAEELGVLLLPPGILPDPGSDLYLVVDGQLGRLPFAALRTAGGRPLVRDYVISYVPSLNALAAIEDDAGSSFTPPVVLGNPSGDLQYAALELNEVARSLGVTPANGSTATVEKLSRSASSRLLHIATHTGLGAEGPWLALADGDVGAGLLVSGDIGPRVVVMATCASAAREGKGMWGSLGAAFLAAGSESVVASLWSVEDSVAREFVELFYGGDDAESTASALARVQRTFIDTGRSPSEWAAFVHFGSQRPLRLDP